MQRSVIVSLLVNCVGFLTIIIIVCGNLRLCLMCTHIAVTVFAASAGRDLFRRVILQSGSALSPAAMMYNPRPTTDAVAAQVNCSLNDELERSTLRLLHCIKQVFDLTSLHCFVHRTTRHLNILMRRSMLFYQDSLMITSCECICTTYYHINLA